MSELREVDLYPPVRDWLEAEGWVVRGEIRQCDVAAVRGSELQVVELKLRLGPTVLAQAARRQQVADTVWVAVPKPTDLVAWRKRSADLLFLASRLELGVLLVAPAARKPGRVRIEVAPTVRDTARDGKLRAAVIREVLGREVDGTPGGSPGVKLVGAHRETAVHIAVVLEREGPLSIAELHRAGTGLTTRSVLEASRHIEGWFERLEDGRYRLRPSGLRALGEHAGVAEHYRRKG